MSDLAIRQKPIVNSQGRILTGLAARKAQLAAELGFPEELKPTQMEHRIGIVFDDSGSMGAAQIADAHEGCEEFLRSCEPNKTAVAIYPMNAEPMLLCTNLPAIAIMVKSIRATGGTPLVQKLGEMMKKNSLTRAIVFSDGCPQGYSELEYDSIKSTKIPVDTAYISSGYIEARAAEFMEKLARDTGGIYLCFERGKSNFRTAFKYLSPGLRYMLADKSFKDQIQGR